MILTAVMDEVAAVLRGVDGLRQVHEHPIPRAAAAGASAIVSYPEGIEFGVTYGRRFDRIVGLPVTLIVSQVTERKARDRVSTLLDPDADPAVSAVASLEAHTWVSCDDLTVTDADFDSVSLAGVDYLAAVLTCNVIGPGRT